MSSGDVPKLLLVQCRQELRRLASSSANRSASQDDSHQLLLQNLAYNADALEPPARQ